MASARIFSRISANVRFLSMREPFGCWMLAIGCWLLAVYKRHAELVSASVRGEMLALYIKACGEILKFVIEREQSQACLNYAEREQIEQR